MSSEYAHPPEVLQALEIRYLQAQITYLTEELSKQATRFKEQNRFFSLALGASHYSRHQYTAERGSDIIFNYDCSGIVMELDLTINVLKAQIAGLEGANCGTHGLTISRLKTERDDFKTQRDGLKIQRNIIAYVVLAWLIYSMFFSG